MLLCVILLATSVILLDLKLRPAIVEIAGAELEAIISDEVNRVCAEDALDGEVAYSDLITFQYDEEGTLIGLTTNMAELNALKATITSGIGNRLENLGQTQISVPLGTVSGVALFSGVGPMIPWKFSMSTGSTAGLTAALRRPASTRQDIGLRC